MEANDHCDECEGEATVFKFQGEYKMKACAQHAANALSQGSVLFPIEAFKFVNSQADYPEFTRRKDQKHEGQAFIGRLRGYLVSEKEQALAGVEQNQVMVSNVINKTYDSMKRKLEERYTAVLQELVELNGQFQRYVESPETDVSDAMRLILNADGSFIPSMLKVQISNQSLDVARALFQGFHSSEDSINKAILLLDQANRSAFVTETASKIQQKLNNLDLTVFERDAFLINELVKMGATAGLELQESNSQWRQLLNNEREFGIAALLDETGIERAVLNFNNADLLAKLSDEAVLEICAYYHAEHVKIVRRGFITVAMILLKHVEEIANMRFPNSPFIHAVHLSMHTLVASMKMNAIEKCYSQKYEANIAERLAQAKKTGREKRICGELFYEHWVPPPEYGSPGVLLIEYTDMTFALMGMDDTPYEGGVFLLDITWPDGYPLSESPKISFRTKIYHPNIDATGQISLNILRDDWCPALSFRTIVISICNLMTRPFPEDPLVPEIAELYLRDRSQFEATAREWTSRYAMNYRSIAQENKDFLPAILR